MKYRIIKYNHWWNINLYIYKGNWRWKEYNLTGFIPHKLKTYLTNRHSVK